MKLDQKTIRLAAGFAMMLAVGASALIYPSLRAASAASSRRDAALKTVESAPDHAAMIAGEAATRDTLAAYVETSVKPIPDEPNSASLIRDITLFLDARNIRDRELAISTPLTIGPIVVTPITITFRASFLDAHALLRHLESANRLLRVRSVRFTRPTQTSHDSLVLVADAPLKVEVLLETLHTPVTLATPRTP